jgi:hypothetical protein
MLPPKCGCDDGRDEYSPLSIVYENGVVIAQIGLGAMLMRSWRIFGLPGLSMTFLLFCAVMLGYVLRRQLCSRCVYYDKWCHCGWGKLAALVVPKVENPEPVKSKLALLFWTSAMFLPLVAVGLALVLSATTFGRELPFLAGFIVTVILSTEMHVRDCKDCRMRHRCPGSAARG